MCGCAPREVSAARRAPHAAQPVLGAVAQMEGVVVQREQASLDGRRRPSEVARQQRRAILGAVKRQPGEIAHALAARERLPDARAREVDQIELAGRRAAPAPVAGQQHVAGGDVAVPEVGVVHAPQRRREPRQQEPAVDLGEELALAARVARAPEVAGLESRDSSGS